MDLGPKSAKVAVPNADKTLFEHDQKVNGLMKQISSYTSITQSANDYEQIKNQDKKAVGMGTMMGVYFPTIQNIFGVILFIRMPWIVGLAGISGAFILVGFCCITTLLTAISMSAIATNGRVPAGGSYYMISRSLGPGWGGAVGIMFYLGTTVASAMYIVGAAEILTLYIGQGRFWGLAEGSGFFMGELNNYRVWGLLMLTVMCMIVFIGVKYVNMSAVPFLAVVLVSILMMFVGFFTSAAAPNPETVICMVGDVLVKRPYDGMCNWHIEDIDQFNFDDEKKATEFGNCVTGKCQFPADAWMKEADSESKTMNGTYPYDTYCSDDSGSWICKTPTAMFERFYTGDNSYNMSDFNPNTNAWTAENSAYPNLLSMPTWNRHGVPGLGYSTESWNVKAHHYEKVNLPVTIPEMLDPEASKETNNVMKCANYDWKEFPDRTEFGATWQWVCAEDEEEQPMWVPDLEAIAAIQSGAAKADVRNSLSKGILTHVDDRSKLPYVSSDMVGKYEISSLMILIGVFFPSVTGIMAGSNRSGDLANGQKSIPKGTIGAIMTTTTAYLACVVLSGFACDGALMRDKYGDALTNGNGKKILMNASITWPIPEVMLYGAFLSSIGAGLQSLTGAPRLLQSIAKDDVIPKFGVFAKGRGKGNEPTWAVFLTYLISALFIVIAKIEMITPFITIFFLMCYLFVNVSTTLSSLIHAPSWRPSFKYYHWSLSLLGSLCCLFLIFIVDWIAAIIIGVMAAGLYILVEAFGAKKEWGDSVKGLHMTIAINSLRSLNNNISTHTKNWRPQILLLNKLKPNTAEFKYPKLLDFCHSLKEGKGLLIVKTLIEGEYSDYIDQREAVQHAIDEQIKLKNIAAIDTGITIAPDIARDAPLMIQSVGLAGLKPNCISLNFPTTTDQGRSDYAFFYNVARHAVATNCSLIVTKNIEAFPEHDQPENGTIDVWWICLDGGLTLLLAHLIKRTSTWKKCQLRIFVTADASDNTEAMLETLNNYLTDMRMNAIVKLVITNSEETLAYAENITARIAAKKASKENVKDVDVAMERARKSCVAPSNRTYSTSTPDSIPRSYSGTWSNNTGAVGPRATVIKKIHQASGLNKKIAEHSAEASLVFLNMPPFPLENNKDQESNYMKYIDSLTRNLKRIVMVRTTGNEVITAYN